jgi:hypothetical protein
LIVVVVPEVALVSVNVAVEVPLMPLVVVIAVVVLTGRVIVDVAVAAIPAKVFAPVTVTVVPAPPFTRRQLNVDPPPAKVRTPVAGVRVMLPVPSPAVVVKPEGAALLNGVTGVPVRRIDPPLNVMFFVPVAVVKLCGHDTVFPFRSNVPFVMVN